MSEDQELDARRERELDEVRRDAYEDERDREFLRGLWRPIETAPMDDTVILRPHRVWGAMDVYRITSAQGWCWMNGDKTTAWTEIAFLPFWMPRPDPPEGA